MTMQASEQAAQTAGHILDSGLIAALLTSPLYWELLDRAGHLILLVLGIIFAALRIWMTCQDIRRKRRRGW